MDPYALQLPRPVERSCTRSSVLLQNEVTRNYSYELLQFDYSAYDSLSNQDGEVYGGLNFLALVQGLDVQLSCEGWNSRLNRNTSLYDPDYWFQCGIWRDVDHGSEGGLQHDDLQTGLANFDAINYVLRLNITWACKDVDPNHP